MMMMMPSFLNNEPIWEMAKEIVFLNQRKKDKHFIIIYINFIETFYWETKKKIREI